MSKPKNKDEYRKEMAEAFARVLEEKGLSWKKEWRGTGGSAPHNAITKANYRGSNAFWLKLVSAMKGYTDPRWVTMVQIMDNDAKYHPKQKWHLKAGSKATYVEYWYPFDLKAKKALTWEQYKQEIQGGRREDEFRLSTHRYSMLAMWKECPSSQSRNRRRTFQSTFWSPDFPWGWAFRSIWTEEMRHIIRPLRMKSICPRLDLSRTITPSMPLHYTSFLIQPVTPPV